MAAANPIQPDKLLTVAEVAERLSISPQWVRAHSARERRPYLPAIKLGGTYRFRPADIEEFLRACADPNRRRS